MRMRTLLIYTNLILKYFVFICFAYLMWNGATLFSPQSIALHRNYHEKGYIFKSNKSNFDELTCELNKLFPLNVSELINNLNPTVQPGIIDITVVTHTTCERITLLNQLAKMWSGAIIVSLFTNKLQFCNEDQLLDIRRISLTHANMLILNVESQKQLLYPFNALRTIASMRVVTSHIIYLDVDMVPNENAYFILKSVLSQELMTMNKGKIALVLPAFEVRDVKASNSIQYPVKDRAQLLKMIKNGVVRPARVWKWFPGHGPTRYDKWMSSTNSFFIDYKLGFEPYVVVPKRAPFPDVRFIGHSRDKSAFALQLRGNGYLFHVLHDVFVVHMEHASSISKSKVKEYEHCNIAAFESLAKEFGEPIEYPKKIDPV